MSLLPTQLIQSLPTKCIKCGDMHVPENIEMECSVCNEYFHTVESLLGICFRCEDKVFIEFENEYNENDLRCHGEWCHYYACPKCVVKLGGCCCDCGDKIENWKLVEDEDK